MLEKLSRLDGVAGQEKAVGEAIAARLREIGLIPETDRMGNIIARREPADPTDPAAAVHMLLCAHMDEVGLLITDITAEGFLKFSPVGGVDRAVLPAKRVRLHGSLPGVVGIKAIHLQKPEERKKLPEIDAFYIDIGATNREDAEKQVKIGDMACFEDSWREFGSELFMGKALDDRAGCALLLEILARDHPCRLTGAFTVQEEIGLRGAQVLANSVRADLVVVLEATAALDAPETEPEETVTVLGGGPVCYLMDAGAVYPRELVRAVTDCARTEGVPLQYRRGAAGGNDAGALQTAGAGLRVVTLALPCRYIHTMHSVASREDYRNWKKLILAFIARQCAAATPPPPGKGA
ncbi:MAG: M42 family peptidase [Gracilibacteraceae bacterium]|jgi:endoglucanase|nr:M42 family peptidase [Gracilibacteraceae bacterium]